MIETYNLFEEFINPEFQVPVTKDEDPEMQCKTVPQVVTRKVRCSKAISLNNKFEDSIGKKKDQLIEGDELSEESSKKQIQHP